MKKLLPLIILSMLIFILDYFDLLQTVKKPLEEIIIPIQKNIYRNISDFRRTASNIRFFSSSADSIAQLQVMRQEFDQLQLKVRLLSEENAMLRKQLGASLPSAYKFLPAAVIAVGADLKIAAGISDGVIQSMPVVFEDNLLGSVGEVSARRSSVSLLSSRDIRLPAKTNRGTRGIVTGMGGNKILLERVLQKDPLFIDDAVITSGEDGFPPNLIIGKIGHILVSDVEVYKSAAVNPGIDITELTTVFVLTGL